MVGDAPSKEAKDQEGHAAAPPAHDQIKLELALGQGQPTDIRTHTSALAAAQK